MPVVSTLTCPLSGLAVNLPVAVADGEPIFELPGDDDDVQRPLGWARLELRVTVPNPEYERVRAFHASSP